MHYLFAPFVTCSTEKQRPNRGIWAQSILIYVPQFHTTRSLDKTFVIFVQFVNLQVQRIQFSSLQCAGGWIWYIGARMLVEHVYPLWRFSWTALIECSSICQFIIILTINCRAECQLTEQKCFSVSRVTKRAGGLLVRRGNSAQVVVGAIIAAILVGESRPRSEVMNQLWMFTMRQGRILCRCCRCQCHCSGF